MVTYLQELPDLRDPGDKLVKITSCLDLPRAELIRMVLAREGIAAALGNANFVYWFWHYSNAVGGVKVYVRRRDVQQAGEALAAARAAPVDGRAVWICPACGQRVTGGWEACWQCGCWQDGTAGDFSAEEIREVAEQPAGAAGWLSVSGIFAFAELLVLQALWRKLGPQTTLLLLPFLAFPVFLLWQFERLPGEESQRHGASEEEDVGHGRQVGTRSAVARAAVRRSWQAAVIAFLKYGPLSFLFELVLRTFSTGRRLPGWTRVGDLLTPLLLNIVAVILSCFSMQLLWKMGRRNTPLSRADTCRSWAAFVLNMVTILSFLILVFESLSCLFAVFGRV